MSEAKKKLEKKTKQRFRFNPMRVNIKKYYSVEADRTLDELANVLTKKEEVNKKIKMTTREFIKQLREIINLLDTLRADEAKDSIRYFELAKKYRNMPTVARLFMSFHDEEETHKEKLRRLADELQLQLKRLSEKLNP